MRRRHYIVFGAWDEADKSLLAYKDKDGTYMLKVLQNKDGLNYDFGDKVGTDYESLKEEISGEYTTLMFGGKNGRKSIDVLIDTLKQVREWMDEDERKANGGASPSGTESLSADLKEWLEKSAEEQRQKEARLSTNTDLYIRDKYSGKIHRVGDNRHDMLLIDRKGRLFYENLQNGDGCWLGKQSDGYEFVPNGDDYGYNFDPREEDSNANG